MKLFGLLGKTLKHSFSKSYFSKKFAEENRADFKYENFELESINQLPALLDLHPDLCGLNVTIPYKEEVIPFLHVQNDVVQKIKACNCIKIREGKLFGFNTDVIGFKQSLEKGLKPHHQKALILGTGGAAKAVQYALELLDIDFTIVSRTKKEGILSYKELNEEIMQEHLLIINTSPVGMFPNVNEAPQIPYEFITPNHYLFDLIYNPEKTLFLQKGEERGAFIANGHEMLVLQAEESWRIWNTESL
ncbi:shikimate dehydrogenase [Chitinophagaceae bacterium LB-8]|uniref:Shikimate dehydrogenase n=1 Tax=Paraflavisolibacter caeni TaxID=2982496 RepID=A0A9X3B6Y7_9BACT|nr:shikimate dehydrogenase [Paraflavisolibacter caeni]MCU7548645.1 shikimate dehydrogenase [Paraflavisolibacter caeni]